MALIEVEQLLKFKKQIKDNKYSLTDLNSILNDLKSININKELLKVSGIGKTIATLAVKSEFEEVKEAAKKLVKKWKKSCLKKTIKVENKKFPDKRAQVVKLLTSSFNKKKIEIEKVNEPKGNTDTELNVDEKRIETVCKAIEISMFRKYKEDVNEQGYKTKFRSLKFNLSKNETLRKDLLEGTIKPFQLVEMTSEMLASKEKRLKMEQEREKLFNEARSDWVEKNRERLNKTAGIEQVGGFFTCEECKSTKTTHYQKQTRGADEPMTIFAQCTECGHNWRFGDH